MSIRLKIFAVIMLIAVAIIAFSISTGLIFVQSKLEQTIEDDMIVVANIADELITTAINLLKADASVVAQRLLQIPEDELSDAMRREIEFYPNFIGLIVIDRSGPVVSAGIAEAYGRAELLEMLNKSEYLPKAFAGESVISTTRYDPKGDLVFHVCVPMGDRVLSASVPGMFFRNIIAKFRIWETGNIFILDPEGVNIADVNSSLVEQRYNSIVNAQTDSEYQSIADTAALMISGKAGFGRYSMYGKERLCIYRPITGSRVGWSLGVVAPLEESPIRNVRNGLLLVGIVSILLSIAVSFFASLSLERPYKQISELAETLKAAEEEALSSTAAKSSFLANMSHEMRTPLNAIIGFSELELGKDSANVPKGYAVPQETRENLQKIYSSGITLLGLINDILDISKIESGKLELIQEEYDLPSLINDTIVLNIMRIGSKPIAFNLDIDESLPGRLSGDELRIKQLMNNFLSNAFKYTEEGSVTLRIACQKEGEIVWLECSVTDTGKGIRPEDLDKLFANYSQVDIKKNRGIEGTGLGLALTKRLVEMMRGAVSVESVYGKGSTFAFRIQQGFVTDIGIGQDLVDNLRKFKYIEDSRNRNTDIVQRYIPYAKVLVVDDIITNLEVARGMMKPYGMTVDCVDSGIKAIAAIREEKVKYNAVFMDHQMPGMDGIEAVRIIRHEIGTEYAKTVPIIALTANAIAGNDVMFLQNGFQAFLTKPIDIRKLNEAINHWVRDKEYEKTIRRNEEFIPPDKPSAVNTSLAVTEFLRTNSVEGIHVENALERFGTGDIWLSSVKTWVASTPALLEDLREIKADTLEQYRITVHGIKGSSYAIAADDVGRLAEELEKAAGAGDLDFIYSHGTPFITAVEDLIGSLKVLVERVEAHFVKPKKPAPEKEYLDRILKAAGSWDIDEMDKAIEELEKYQYESQGDIVLWLKEQIGMSQFDKIHERLSAKTFDGDQ
ncbi:hypothetical protein FACS1894151_00580 [Spirochaetia bacterium]|nr:hypothetical protein FACS1894151_00580 [Spirochaetia bacterium]